MSRDIADLSSDEEIEKTLQRLDCRFTDNEEEEQYQSVVEKNSLGRSAASRILRKNLKWSYRRQNPDNYLNERHMRWFKFMKMLKKFHATGKGAQEQTHIGLTVIECSAVRTLILMKRL
jgi:hypothetical protein